MTTQGNPMYNSQPVILIHLLAEPNSNKAYCADFDYYGDNGSSYIGIPRVLCPACARAPRDYSR